METGAKQLWHHFVSVANLLKYTSQSRSIEKADYGSYSNKKRGMRGKADRNIVPSCADKCGAEPGNNFIKKRRMTSLSIERESVYEVDPNQVRQMLWHDEDHQYHPKKSTWFD